MTASNADLAVVSADFVVAFLASTFWLILSAVSSDNSLQSSGKEHITKTVQSIYFLPRPFSQLPEGRL